MIKKASGINLVALLLTLLLLFTACAGPSTTLSGVSSGSSTGEQSNFASSEGNFSGVESTPDRGSVESNGNIMNSTNSKNGTISKGGSSSSSSRSTSSTTPPVIEPGVPTLPPENYSAYWLNPIKSLVNTEANALRNQILNAPNGSPPSGRTTYYVSESKGEDSNNGISSSTPWKTIDKMNGAPENANVLFERGGVYRGTFTAKSNCYYGAYGSGAKPCIYGSKENSASVSKWTQQSGTNIWILSTTYADVGVVVINEGRQVGVRKPSLTDLKKNLDFYSNGTNLYLYCDQNPGSKYSSIEVGDKRHIISIPALTNVTIENLTVKYGGAHGISSTGHSKNIKIRNCEIAWIGGSMLSPNVPFGNGVELWDGGQDVLVENCWVYQIFDSGLSHQGNQNLVKNITFRSNLIEYCGYSSIEFWHHPRNTTQMENILYTKNILRFADYGWEKLQRPDSKHCHILGPSGMDNMVIGGTFEISENIIELSNAGNLIQITSLANTPPAFKGNIYIQKKGYGLGTYGGVTTAMPFDERVQNFISAANRLNDTTGKAIYWTGD